MLVSSPRILLLLFGIGLGTLLSALADPPRDPVVGVQQLRVGMTAAQVMEQFGPPQHVCRQILLHRSIDLWHYGPPLNLQLKFECQRGKKPSLRSWKLTQNLFP